MLTRLRTLLHPFEWLALAGTAAVMVYLRAHHLRVGWRALELTVPPMFQMLPRVAGVGLAIHLVLSLARRESILDYLAHTLRPASILLWLRVCVSLMLVTFAYTWLKVCVPLVNLRVWDLELGRFDRWLHFGSSPSVVVVKLLDGTLVLPLLDRWYPLWLQSVQLIWAWAALHADFALRRRFAVGCGLLWISGAWLYLALPALGPCYAAPKPFIAIEDQIPRAASAQRTLANNYAKMIAGRDGTLRQFNPFESIAAMPSLHVGAHWFFALWAWHYARRLFLPCALATGLTFLGSLALGWHYAIDGYAGMLLAWGAIALAERFEPLPAPPQAEAATAATESPQPPGEAP